ncbi:HNH endonuclease [Pseudomonas sp. Irchel s3f7]|uniref:HNH endonuclease n=1 Tax=Pseudomonas sp. Irchel s3f7 TaxID=2009153 RepID=UPI0035315B3D
MIWILLHGSIDEALVIDHLNGVGTDNRLINLRLVAHSENQRNLSLRVTNRSGVIGVYWCRKTMKWTGQITTNGKHKCIGYYLSIDDAANARKALEREFGYHELHGMPVARKAASI